MSCCRSCAENKPCEGSKVGAASTPPFLDLAASVLPFTPFAPLSTLFQAPSEAPERRKSSGVTDAQEAQFASLSQRWNSLLASRLPAAIQAHAVEWLPFSTAWQAGVKQPDRLPSFAARVDDLERARLQSLRMHKPRSQRNKILIGAGLVVAGGLVAIVAKKVIP